MEPEIKVTKWPVKVNCINDHSKAESMKGPISRKGLERVRCDKWWKGHLLLALAIQKSSNDCKLAENRLATDNGGVMPKLVVFWITAKAMPRWWTWRQRQLPAWKCCQGPSASMMDNSCSIPEAIIQKTLASLKHHRKYESQNGGGPCYFSQQYSASGGSYFSKSNLTFLYSLRL